MTRYPQSRERGLVMIWVAILMLVFAAFVGIALDTWYAVWTAQQLQVGADSAALAGARLVRKDVDDAREATLALANANTAATDAIQLDPNEGNDEEGDVVMGRYRRDEGTFTATLTDPNAVKVRARRTADAPGGPLGLLFGPIFGTDTAEVDRYAIGMVGGELPLGIVCLDPSGKGAFDIRGSVSVEIRDGGIQVNSSHGDAATHSGSTSALNVSEMYLTGATDSNWEQVKFDGELYEGIPPIDDPLAALPQPTYNSNLVVPGVTLNNITTYLPGYHNGISQTATNQTLVFSPGVHIINGPLKVAGGNVIGNGVMLFIGPNGSIDLGGNGSVNLSPISSLTYPLGPVIPSDLINSRVTIFQSRSNSAASKIVGGSNFRLDGRVYMPNSELNIGGNSGVFGTGLIAYRINVFGSGTLNIGGDPFILEYPRFVFLVE